jgi:hypothetical protein
MHTSPDFRVEDFSCASFFWAIKCEEVAQNLVLRYFQWVECVGIRSFPATKYSMVII